MDSFILGQSEQWCIKSPDKLYKLVSHLSSLKVRKVSACHFMNQARKRTDQSAKEVIDDTPPLKHVHVACPPAPIKEKVDSETRDSENPAVSPGQTRQLRNT